MLQSSRFLMCATLCVATTMLLITPAVDASTEVHSLLTLLPATTTTTTTAVCDASMTAYDSEISRRILAPKKKYISYGALNKNTVPCSKHGASYYNCKAGAQANPYSRGCTAITRCRH